MTGSISDNGRIARNTIYLYIRTGVVMFVSLFSTRIVLQALGVEGVGIYNVVAGIVAIMAFFQSSLTTSTSRFLAFEIGEGGSASGRTFSLCMTIHLLVALVVLVLGETAGVLLVNFLTEIPPERMAAANIVYQFSLAVFCLNILRVPYDAAIVAHEQMKIYAIFSVVEALLQLAIAYLALVLCGDSLVNYGWLQLVSVLFLFLLYMGYVRRGHSDYRFSIAWEKGKSLKILSFSGWILLGSFSNTISIQGVNLLFNNFVGLVANAALGFANQVNGAVSRFLNSFNTAFNPQIIKLCASGDTGRLNTLVFRASKFSFVLVFAMALPIMMNMEMLLELWLGMVPQYAVDFCTLILVCTVIDAISGPYNTAINATGKIRNYQIWISASFFLGVAITLALLLMDLNPALVFASRILTRGLLNMFIGLHYCKKQISFNVTAYLRSVLIPIMISIVITIIPVLLVSYYLSSGWIHLISTTAVTETILFISTITLICNGDEREKLKTFLRNKHLL